MGSDKRAKDSFSIEILEVTDNDDGSATVTFEMDEKARNMLIEIGLTSLLEKQIDAQSQRKH